MFSLKYLLNFFIFWVEIFLRLHKILLTIFPPNLCQIIKRKIWQTLKILENLFFGIGKDKISFECPQCLTFQRKIADDAIF